MFDGLQFQRSKFVADGVWLWLRGNDVIGIHNTKGERAKLFGTLGLAVEAPPGTTGIGLSPRDYDEVAAALQAFTAIRPERTHGEGGGR